MIYIKNFKYWFNFQMEMIKLKFKQCNNRFNYLSGCKIGMKNNTLNKKKRIVTYA